MASRYFGINRGQNEEGDVTNASSTQTKSVELVVNLAASMDREEVLLAVDLLQRAILKADWPPA